MIPLVTEIPNFQYPASKPFFVGFLRPFGILLCVGFPLAKIAEKTQIHPKLLRTAKKLCKIFLTVIYVILIL